MARHGGARHGEARQGEVGHGEAGLGAAWHGKARHGMAGLGAARRGYFFCSRTGMYGQSYRDARRERLRFAQGRCETCNADGPLECHHRCGEAYERDERNAMTMNDCVMLCVPCHDLHTSANRAARYAAADDITIDTVREPESGRTNHAMAGTDCSVDIHSPSTHAQWPVVRPDE